MFWVHPYHGVFVGQIFVEAMGADMLCALFHGFPAINYLRNCKALPYGRRIRAVAGWCAGDKDNGKYYCVHGASPVGVVH